MQDDICQEFKNAVGNLNSHCGVASFVISPASHVASIYNSFTYRWKIKRKVQERF